MTRTDRRRFPIMLAVIAALALAMTLLFSPVQAQEGSAPDKPRGLSATATHDQVVLTWDDPGDDTITGYVILRRIPGVDPEGQFSELVSNTGTDATTYTDDTVSAETRYTYRIKAINEHGVSERSRWFHIDTPAAPEAVEGDDQDEQDGEDDDGGAPGHATPPGPGGRANVSEGGTDLPQDTTTTGAVDVGGSVTGKIRNLNDKDWFAVELEAGKRYQIDMEGANTGRGTLTHPRVGGIYDAASNAIANTANNGGGVGNNARVIYTPDAAGTYYVEAYFETGEVNRTYTLSVILLGANGASEGGNDCPGHGSTTCQVDVGASATGNIGASGDSEWFKVVLEADKTYQIDMEGGDTNGGTLVNPKLLDIKDSEGDTIADTGNDDIDGDNFNSQITFTPTAAGTYYLVAASGVTGGTGTYTLSVRDITPPPDDSADPSIVLVSNIEQAVDSIVTPDPVFQNYAVQFTTGGNTGGYNLDSVELKVTDYENVVVRVSLYSDSSGVPGSSIFTFDNPDPITANANNTFTAPANTTLMASTPYHIVVSGANDPDESTNTIRLTATSSNAEDSGGATNSEGNPDWAIADDGYFYSSSAWHSNSRSIQIRVNGSAASDEDDPPLSTDATLSPAFASGTATYTASVANSVDEVTVTPPTNHASATVEILDTDDNEFDDADDGEDDFQVALSVGDTVIKVKVTAEDGTSTQTYTVTVTRDDFPADTTTTGQVDVGGSVTGNIASASDRDWFRVDLKKDKRYQIDLEGADTNRGTLTDPLLNAMRDASDNSITGTVNDDSGVGINARTIFTAPADGTHYVVAAANGATGTYTLSVIVLGANGASEADTDFPSHNRTSGRVEVGASATGNMDRGSDFDWFRVDLEAGKTYQFDLEGSPTGRGSLADPLLQIFDASGSNKLAEDNNGGTGANAQIVYTATATGAHYLTAQTLPNSTGTYTLSVLDITLATCTLNTGDVWCGVVTVGTFMIGGTSHLGYLDGTGGGMLSDNDFEFTDTDLDSASHTITAVALASGTLNLVFEIVQDEDDKPVLNTWDLQVGTDTFALDGANVTQLPTGGYRLTGTGLSWSVGDTVTLRLRGESGPPSVANVAVTSMPLLTSSGGSEQDTYGAGDEIEFTVTFNRAVVVMGDPQFGFSLSGARQADYRSGSGSTALKFVYTVQSSDSDDDGIWIGNHNSNTKSLQLDSNDEITSPGGIDANLEHDQKQVQAGHKVDGSRSSKPTLSVADAAATEGSNVSFTVTLSAAAATTVTATWTASIETGDTAVAADLGATKTGTVEITAGDTDATITVATVEDTTVEVNETFTVTLSGVSSNAQLETDPTATGTINDDDGTTLSTDATLSALSLGTGVTLSPAFASGTATYTASVANSVDEVTVTPTTNHASATVEILDTDDNELDDADDVEDDFQVALSVGDTVIKVKVTAEDGTSTQTYTVTVTHDDFPADTTTTGQVDVGGSVTGNIESVGDGDWFLVELEAGTRYQIDLEGAPTGRGTVPDPIINVVRDAGGNTITGTVNDDSGIGNNARTIFTATADGTHYVVAAAIGTTGTYTLSVIVLGANGASEADTDFSETTATTGRVEVGASVTGNIEDITDADWFAVVLEAGKTYQIDQKGESGGGGTLGDPVLDNIRDSSGTEIEGTENDDIDFENDIFDSQIIFTPTAAGTYYLVASRLGTGT